MSELRVSGESQVFDHETGQWRDRTLSDRVKNTTGISMGWLLGGVAAVAVGYFVVNRFGPDLVRYIKMERM